MWAMLSSCNASWQLILYLPIISLIFPKARIKHRRCTLAILIDIAVILRGKNTEWAISMFYFASTCSKNIMYRICRERREDWWRHPTRGLMASHTVIYIIIIHDKMTAFWLVDKSAILIQCKKCNTVQENVIQCNFCNFIFCNWNTLFDFCRSDKWLFAVMILSIEWINYFARDASASLSWLWVYIRRERTV